MDIRNVLAVVGGILGILGMVRLAPDVPRIYRWVKQRMAAPGKRIAALE